MAKENIGADAVLYIDPSWSYCGACGAMADPYQSQHRTVPPGMTTQPIREGCHARFTQLSSHYMGHDIRAAGLKMRPDLPWKPRMIEDTSEASS